MCSHSYNITFSMFLYLVIVVYHKHGSAYSRTEPENAKTGCQDLSPSARWARTEFINVFIKPFLACVSKLVSIDHCTKKL